MLITASSDKVDSFASLQNFIGQVVCQKCWDHHIVELVFLSPEFVISHIWISFHEKFLKWIIYLSCYHPSFDHWKNRSGNFLQDPTNEVLSTWTSIENISVDSGANGSTFQILDKICDDCEPLHALEWFLHPQVKFPKIQIICRVFASVVYALGIEHSEQAIVLCQLSLDSKAEALRDLIDTWIRRVSSIAGYPIVNFLEKPSKFAKFTDQFVRRWGHSDLWLQNVGIFKQLIFDESSINALEHKQQLPYNHVFIDLALGTAKSQCSQIV